MFVMIDEETAVNPEQITQIREYYSTEKERYNVAIHFTSGTNSVYIPNQRIVDVLGKLRGITV